MKFLRLLRRQLHRQLGLIYEGRIAQAQEMLESIARTVSRLEGSPPQGDPELIEHLQAQCHELNELVLEHFEAERDNLADYILKLQVERRIQEFRKDIRSESD